MSKPSDSYRILHTADWHLGQTFHGQERHVEQRAFLDWLLTTLDTRRPVAPPPAARHRRCGTRRWPT